MYSIYVYTITGGENVCFKDFYLITPTHSNKLQTNDLCYCFNNGHKLYFIILILIILKNIPY